MNEKYTDDNINYEPRTNNKSKMEVFIMEANKIQGECKSIILDNGAELTYCEKGKENEEVLITGAFYFHTFMPVVEGLAKKYHVYGIVMRFDGPGDELEEDGSIHWGRQWGKDVYDFANKMNIKKFHYAGKCHGTVPGWYLVKEHPEMLLSFSSFFLAPHLAGQSSNHWLEMMNGGDTTKMMEAAMRKPEGLKKKMEEMQALGGNVSSPAVPKYASSPEKIWPSLEECENDLRNTEVKVGFLFGTDDPLFQDYYDSNMQIYKVVKGNRFVILQGERHLMELDCPERVVNEILMNIEEGKGYN